MAQPIEDPTSKELPHPLDGRQERYLSWLLTLPDERVPATKAALAAELGVSPRTMKGWEDKRAFRERWERESREIQGSPERTRMVMDALYERSLKGDVSAAKVWLQTLGKIEPPASKVEVTHRGSAKELSDEDLDELIAAAAAREKDERTLRAV